MVYQIWIWYTKSGFGIRNLDLVYEIWIWYTKFRFGRIEVKGISLGRVFTTPSSIFHEKETKKGCYNFFKSSQFQSITPQISKSHSTFGSKISHIIIDGQYVLENCNFSKRLGDFALQCTKGPRRTIFCINFKTKSRFFCVSTFEKCPNGKFVTSNCKETCGCDRNFSESTVRNLD